MNTQHPKVKLDYYFRIDIKHERNKQHMKKLLVEFLLAKANGQL